MKELLQDNPVLLLKTYDTEGQIRVDPVHYRPFGGGYVVMASHVSDTSKPNWYLNLKSDPEVEVDVNGVEHFARATTPIGRDRMEIWPLVESLAGSVERERPRNITGVLLMPLD